MMKEVSGFQIAADFAKQRGEKNVGIMGIEGGRGVLAVSKFDFGTAKALYSGML